MEYLLFSLWFMLIHVGSYMFAGIIALRISKDIYEGRQRLMDYLRDMSEEKERKVVEKFVLPGQVVRGFLLSLPLYFLIGPLGELSFLAQFATVFGLLFIYTHVSSAAPCPDNIEGFIYLKERYFSKKAFLKFQMEMVIYSFMASILAAGFLF